MPLSSRFPHTAATTLVLVAFSAKASANPAASSANRNKNETKRKPPIAPLATTCSDFESSPTTSHPLRHPHGSKHTMK